MDAQLCRYRLLTLSLHQAYGLDDCRVSSKSFTMQTILNYDTFQPAYGHLLYKCSPLYSTDMRSHINKVPIFHFNDDFEQLMPTRYTGGEHVFVYRLKPSAFITQYEYVIV